MTVIAVMQISQNFIRPHMGLENQTPAQRAGIGIEGQNKWMELLKKAVGESK
jgi:hypothetical protein